MYRIGSGYFGSPDTQISTELVEIIQQHKPSSWITPKLNVYKFSFMNSEDCHIKINESSSQIFLPAGSGFEMSEVDGELWSFVIVEAGVNYTYIGGY